MHKNKFNLFENIRNLLQFLQIVTLFSILMLLLYWIQNLTNSFWTWFKPIAFFLDYFIQIGASISSGSITLLNAIFEFKYFITLLIFGFIYFIFYFIIICVYKIEELFNKGVIFAKKIEEKRLNKQLEKQITTEEKRIKKYHIYIETSIKSKYSSNEYNINLEEQNQILIKHLLNKTNQCPQKYENGYIFTFDDFDNVDTKLEIFSKILESNAPIDYVICIQILSTNFSQEISQLKSLIKLKFLNKIIMTADTAYRYKFNELCKYETSQLGIFQKGNGTIEIHQFIKKS